LNPFVDVNLSWSLLMNRQRRTSKSFTPWLRNVRVLVVLVVEVVQRTADQ